jgi:hypothetical protein
MSSHKTDNQIGRGGWVKMTPAEIIAFSDESRQAIKRKLDETIDRYMRPVVVRPPLTKKSKSWANTIDLYTKWRGNDLILIAKRQGGIVMKQHREDFETKHGRLTLIGVDTFDVSYFRYTGKWWTIDQDLTLKQALAYFRKSSPVWPW